MKKLFTFLVCVLLVFALASCGDDPCQHRDANDNSLCDECGENYTDEKDLPDEHTHDYTVKNTDSEYLATAADCENAATYFYSCSCGAKGTETFTSGNACGHIYSDEWTIDIQATCITKGSKSHHCTRCNGKSELTEIPTTSLHNVVDGYCDYCDRQESTDGLEYAQNPDGTYTVTGIGTCALQDIVIEIYNNRDVTSIGSEAFLACSGLTNVVIGDNVTTIGDYAFVDCTSLTSVTIPDSVTSIGEGAFFRSGLTSVAIGKGVTSIGDGAFCGCDITSIAVDENNNCFRSIDGNLYTKDKQTLIRYAVGKTDTEFIISDSVTSIGNFAFEYCTNLTSVTIPNSVTSIGSHAFEYCDSLTSITIPDSVTSIGSYAFYFCYSLTSVTIPDSVTSIGSYAFYFCYSLTSVTIPDSVTSIGSYAFCNCDSLTSIKYRGTSSEWSAISKGYYWNYGTGSYTITYNYEGE